jgi:hypothetical protein
MANFAQLTKMDDFQELLKPFLIPRTIGSEGHKKVEEVCLAFQQKTPFFSLLKQL